MKLYNLKTNERLLPLGIDGIPCFSWKIQSNKDNVLQAAYRIEISGLWDSGRIESREQAFISYRGPALEHGKQYTWRVTVWDQTGESATAEASFEIAKPSWRGQWAESSIPRKKTELSDDAQATENNPGSPAVMFERVFIVPEKQITRARVYATACGVYRLRVNEKRPDDREFAPEYTSYEKLQYFQTYDVTALIHAGANKLNFHVGDGWYFSGRASPIFGESHPAPSVLYQVEVHYADGTMDVICSDGSEKCAAGFIVRSNIFQGEIQDARLAFRDWLPVNMKDYGADHLLAQPMDPIRPVRLVDAIAVFKTPRGETIVDFGQMIAGRARIRIDLPRNQEAVFEYFEVLDQEGNYINTMIPAQKDIFISCGQPVLHESLFTCHGFRYIRVTGMNDVRKEDFTAVLLTTEKENLGSFECSSPQLSRLYQNIRWSQYNNMMSIPTDCPTREKAGWTGDILVYAKTALTNENVSAFLTAWLKNVRADQRGDGAVMITSPYQRLYHILVGNEFRSFGDTEPTNVAGWSDAIVWVPYEMYRVTGNKVVLRENFEAMRRFCDAVIKTANEKRGDAGIPEEYDRWLFNTGFHFGEWLIPSDPVGSYDICRNSSYYAAPMFAFMSMKKMAEVCAVLGEPSGQYEEAARKMKDAIIQGIMYGNRMPRDKMGAYVLAFAFNLVPDDKRQEYADRLVSLIEENDYCLDTGFLATPFILDALCGIGRSDLAHRLLWQTKMPSWLYEVENGATSVWEAWNADEARRIPRFISFDHYAFGIVDDWIMRRLCGIDTDTVGYDHLIIAPERDAHISWLQRTFDTVHGPVRVAYRDSALTVDVPPNATATVIWMGRQYEIGSGHYSFP